MAIAFFGWLIENGESRYVVVDSRSLVMTCSVYMGLMYHERSNLPSSRNINEIYAQAMSGRVKQATLLVVILSHDSPYNSMLKCIFLYVYMILHHDICVLLLINCLRSIVSQNV